MSTDWSDAAVKAAGYSAALAALALPVEALSAVTPISGLPAGNGVVPLTASASAGVDGYATRYSFSFSGGPYGTVFYSAFSYRFGFVDAVSGLQAFLPVNSGDVIASDLPNVLSNLSTNTSTFTFATNTTALQYLPEPPASRTVLVGFKTVADRNGWLRVVFNDPNLGVAGILEGAVGDPGEPVIAGSFNQVPLPATLPLAALGVLALGAAGLRRKRKAA